ncbi:DUF3833 family protein [Rhodopila sp.]|uniref:DUF3833 family protein n=1 Tax=Rhodopila sp. TaxID=2480087 RepID=UPI003D0C0D81
MRFPLLIACAAVFLTTGCDRSTVPPNLGGTSSAFDPLIFFNGQIRSWGVVESRSGAPTGWVMTQCAGHDDGPDRLHMVQHLSFENSSPQDRRWTLWRTGPNRFEATANDMVGSAKGESVGRAFHWQWVLARFPGERPFDVTMNQWMYQLDDGSVMIRTTISKLGIILAEVSEQFAHTGTPRTAGQIARPADPPS